MSYESKFELKVTPDDPSKSKYDIIADFRHNNLNAHLAFNYDGSPDLETDWENYDDEIRTYSEDRPGILFQIIRYGEIQDDIAWGFFKNGKSYTDYFKLPEFDESKLK